MNPKYSLKDKLFYLSVYLQILILVAITISLFIDVYQGKDIGSLGIVDFLIISFLLAEIINFRKKFIMPYLLESGNQKEIEKEQNIEQTFQYGSQSFYSVAKYDIKLLVTILVILAIAFAVVAISFRNTDLASERIIPSWFVILIPTLIFISIFIFNLYAFLKNRKLQEKYIPQSALPITKFITGAVWLIIFVYMLFLMGKVLFVLSSQSF